MIEWERKHQFVIVTFISFNAFSSQSISFKIPSRRFSEITVIASRLHEFTSSLKFAGTSLFSSRNFIILLGKKSWIWHYNQKSLTSRWNLWLSNPRIPCIVWLFLGSTLFCLLTFAFCATFLLAWNNFS